MDTLDIAFRIAEIGAGLGAGLGSIGLGAGILRAAWRAGGIFGSDIDTQRLAMQAQVDLAKAQAMITQASTDRAMVLKPSNVTYAPHLTDHRSFVPNRTMSLASLPLPDEGDIFLPSFADLLNQRLVGKGNPLCLGYVQGKPLNGSWLDLYSCALGGLPGSGKTTSQRFLAAQTAMHGASFIVCDPHYGTSDDSLGATLAPLSKIFACDVADEEDSILAAVNLVHDEGERRLKNRERKPMILWIDELTALLNSKIGERLSVVLEEIARQYRKVGIYLSASGQIWLASRSGGSSALRDSFASVLAHRMKRSQARLLLPSDDAQKCERLPTGSAILYRTSGDSEIVTIPNTTPEDVQRVAGLLMDGSESLLELPQKEASGKDKGIGLEGKETRYQRREEQRDPENARILSLFKNGKSVREIAIECCGTGSGRAYQESSEKVQAVLRACIG